MNSNKKKNLEETYERILNVGFCIVPYEDLSDITGPNPMVYGTAKDERILSFEGVEALFRSQYEQIGNMKPAYDRKRIALRISNDGNNACIIEEIIFTLSSNEEIHTIFMRATCVMEYLDNQWKLTHWHTSTPVDTENDPWHMEEWKREKEKLQKLVDQQTAALKQNNRELQIEAALERIRSSSLAMHKTDDLQNVLAVLFEQMQELSVDMGFATVSIFIFEEGSRDFVQWQPTTDGVESLNVPYIDHPISSDLFDAWEDGTDHFEKKYTVKEKNTWLEKGFEHTDYKNLSGEFKNSLLEAPGYAMSISLGKHSGICIPSFEGQLPSPENVAILKRVGKVFEQAYTRFIDLQKVEAQAREAEIELALERVRSRSLAMHHSSELSSVVDTLLQEFTGLDFTLTFCIINLIDGDDLSNTVWAANPKTGKDAESYYMKFEDYDFHRAMWNAWKAQDKRFVYVLEGEEKKIYDEYLYSKTEFRRFPKHVQEANKTLERYVAGFTFFKYSGLQTVSINPISEEELAILERFGKVFEQAYIRFLDLQRAEEQAREAQIEAALERIRSKAIAMQNTDDIADTVITFFEELLGLGLDKTMRAGIGILSQEERMKFWTASVPDDSEVILHSGFLEMYRHPLLAGAKQAWADGNPYFDYVLEDEDILNYYQTLNEAPDYPAVFDLQNLPETFHHRSYVFKDGLLYTFTETELPHDISKTLDRFVAALGQTYTRYLDLQKAEEQAQEAQIEAALEKVRSRSLAMHKSEELNEVVAVLFEKLKDLQIPFTAVGIATRIEGSKDLNGFVCGDNADGLVITNYRLPYFENQIPKDCYNALEKQLDFFVGHYSKEEKDAFYSYVMEHTPEFRHLPADIKQMIFDSTNYTISTVAVKNAVFNVNDFEGKVLAEDDIDILQRFARVFNQTYTRFLDLQKLEAQSKEARLEAALEKVRGVALGLQKSDDMLEIAQVLYEQLLGLGFNNMRNALIDFHNGADETFTDYDYSHEMSGTVTLMSYNDDPTLQEQFRKMVSKTDDFFEIVLEGEKLQDLIEMRLKNGEAEDPRLRKIDKLTYNMYSFGNGSIGISNFGVLDKAHKQILERFRNVFTFAYKRYSDLVQAEVQLRKTKIETALEKVRSRTMGMQRSDELADVANVLFAEMNGLVHNLWTCGFVLCEKGREEDEWWLSLEDGFSRGFLLPNVNDYAHATLYEGWLEEDSFRTVQLDGDKLQEHYDWLMQIPVAKNIFDDMEAAGMQRPEWQKLHAAYFSKGYLVIITREPCPEEEIFKRFAKVFDQTYTRFLDLQKAEAQARESKIETALEKVRSRTMGMQSSDELPEVANMLFLEVQALGIPAWSCGYNILEEDKKYAKAWMSSEGVLQEPFKLRLYGEASFDEMGDFVLSKDTLLVQELGGRAIEEHYKYMKSFPDLQSTFKNIEEKGLSLPTYQINHLCKFNHGFILFITYRQVPEAHEVFKRFTKVFDQTYTRFLDLQKAEAQAKESQIELSLERIRAEVASMQESSDLLDIVVTMRTEFVKLGHEAQYFWHMRWLPETYAKAMTSGDGTKIGMVMTLPRKIHGEIQEVADWEQGREPSHVLAMDAEKAVDYIHKMITWGDFEMVDPQAPSLDDIRHIGGLTFIMARTTHGEIGFSLPGVVPEPSKDAMDTLVRFAGVFDLAYKRFEDLKAAERQAQLIRDERDRLEIALTELRATQNQLVQQEKLASLGQLTAGIAHEIKNPLNFVNNFSDLSLELIAETREELSSLSDQLSAEDREKVEEAGEILNDVEENLRKIHKHGTRADSIVKSMLQHSRGGSGTMAPTNLNSLVEEYANLAFHGMRAGKKPINVTIKQELDPDIKEVSLIEEDFTRVVLNLFNNAFDAMHETESLRPPILTVRTHKNDQHISIEIEDNGPGIPEDIRDKILQPFFTTKKGTEGTGLGLSITHDIIKAHGGEINIFSEIDKGTTFTITLKI